MKIQSWFKNIGIKFKRLSNIIRIIIIELIITLIITNGFFIWVLMHYKLLDDLILRMIGK